MGPRVVLLVAAWLPLLGAGCREEKGPSPYTRSEFFTELSSPTGTAALKAWVEAKVPGRVVVVGQTGPMTIYPPDKAKRPRVHVQVQVGLVDRRVAGADTSLLVDVGEYLKVLAKRADVFIDGPVFDETRDWKKVGLEFPYSARGNTGIVSVVSDDRLLGVFNIGVTEWE
jgi:hypothetical protein